LTSHETGWKRRWTSS